jgi:hypothetical protein
MSNRGKITTVTVIGAGSGGFGLITNQGPQLYNAEEPTFVRF